MLKNMFQYTHTKHLLRQGQTRFRTTRAPRLKHICTKKVEQIIFSRSWSLIQSFFLARVDTQNRSFRSCGPEYTAMSFPLMRWLILGLCMLKKVVIAIFFFCKFVILYSDNIRKVSINLKRGKINSKKKREFKFSQKLACPDT